MFMNKITVAATVLLAIGFLTAGGNLLTYQSFKAEEPKLPKATPNAGQGKQGKKQKVNPTPSAEPSRADRLKALRDAYTKERDKFSQDIRAGKIKRNADGEFPGWKDRLERYAKSARKLIDEDPADAVACDALVFCIADLGSGGYETDPGLFRFVLEHHAASEKIRGLVSNKAPTDFLQAIADKSPHAKIRLWANYHLAEKLYAAGKTKEAEPLLEAVSRDKQAKEIGGYVMGTLVDTANRLLFEMRRLNVGQEIPEIEGTDLDGKPLKLSESRGKVTLLVFWATWCMPCMEMVPHERALAERYAGKPFVIVGVNGDRLPFEVAGKKAHHLAFGGKVGIRDGKLYDPDGKVIGDMASLDAEIEKGDKADPKIKAAIEKGLIKVIDDTAKVKAAVQKHKISWRSFRNSQTEIALSWNVRAWPTIFLIDHHGIIRGKWKGDPGEKMLDTATENLVRLAEKAKDRK